ncbi:MAG: glycerate kinase [Oscillatoriaceae bacterium SKW80]|nr:glycerate kinase [Oscillatoriaceae bacterium SKYG93]MCX8120263.1 glycerate kinase [Oscillatoriaceae bacterium SKW80]MDW8453189.1 glycerate kinase [Oscillatoriaceae cyanobacterium SKYGB_i_bin93]
MAQILELWESGYLSAADALPQLIALELEDEERARAFGILPATVAESLQERGRLFEAIAPKLEKRFSRETLWKFWLPLGLSLAASRRQLKHPLIQGILGCQGTGKTTLAAVLKLILAELGFCAVGLSLDDLYKTYRERQLLAQEDPRLIWRGPPGTHDVDLGIEVLEKLRHPDGKPIALPRFDKSACNGAGDRSEPEIIENADIVLFEGWFVGVRPISPAAFDTAPAPIITADERQLARDMNVKLYDYLPLWQRLDRLMVLYPVDYRLSLLWRKQAEQEMRAAGKSGMSDTEIEQFVNYFWKALHPELFIKPLVEKGEGVDLVVEIKSDRSVGAIYQPGNFRR